MQKTNKELLSIPNSVISSSACAGKIFSLSSKGTQKLKRRSCCTSKVSQNCQKACAVPYHTDNIMINTENRREIKMT